MPMGVAGQAADRGRNGRRQDRAEALVVARPLRGTIATAERSAPVCCDEREAGPSDPRASAVGGHAAPHAAAGSGRNPRSGAAGALEAADRFDLAPAFAHAFGDVVLAAFVADQADDRDAPQRGVGLPVAAAVEPGRWILPLLAGIGLQPVRAAKDRSLTIRSGLSPAVMSRVEAVSGPTPCSSTSSGATAGGDAP